MAKSNMKKKQQYRDPLESLDRKRQKALERVVAIYSRPEGPKEGPDELNRAVDALALAHIAATFEFLG
jgi:hypothetical protein